MFYDEQINAERKGEREKERERRGEREIVFEDNLTCILYDIYSYFVGTFIKAYNLWFF